MMKATSSDPTSSRTNPTYNQKHEPLVDIQNLVVQFPGASGPVTVIDNLSLSIAHGEILGLVGESGCGKSMLARSIMGLVPAPGKVTAGHILLKGDDLLKLDEAAMRNVRGDQISIILQEPMTSLNPVFTVGNQITEVLAIHRPEMRQNERRQHAIDMMERMGIQSPEIRMDQYPHELSGGIRQRVMISIALICGNVQLLIADEPTTALDVTIQAQILGLFIKLQTEHQMALLLITHDLSVIAQTAHRVAVMYAGQLVEIADVVPLFDSPLHPYTRGLMRSLPRIGTRPRKSHMHAIPGTVPKLTELPPGCPFFDRCEHRREEPCLNTNPQLEEATDGHWIRCHRWSDIPGYKPASPLTATL